MILCSLSVFGYVTSFSSRACPLVDQKDKNLIPIEMGKNERDPEYIKFSNTRGMYIVYRIFTIGIFVMYAEH